MDLLDLANSDAGLIITSGQSFLRRGDLAERFPRLSDLDLPNTLPSNNSLEHYISSRDLTRSELAIVNSGPFERLCDISQMTVGFTTRGSFMTHNRAEHSLIVLDQVDEVFRYLRESTSLESVMEPKLIRHLLSDETYENMRMAALLHDIAHPAFAHCGEMIINSFSKRVKGQEGFCHEKAGIKLIREKFADILADRLESVVGMLDKTHPFSYLLKDLDRVAYLIKDYYNSTVSKESKAGAFAICYEFKKSLLINPLYNGTTDTSAIGLKDLNPAGGAANLRLHLFREFSCHAWAGLANNFLRDACHRAVQAGNLDTGLIASGSEKEVISKLEPGSRELINSRALDLHFKPAAGFTYQDLTYEGRKACASLVSMDQAFKTSGLKRSDMSQLEYSIRSALIEEGFDVKKPGFQIVITPECEKLVAYQNLNYNLPNAVMAGEDFKKRYVAILQDKSTTYTTCEQISEISARAMCNSKFLEKTYTNPTLVAHNALGNQEPSLY